METTGGHGGSQETKEFNGRPRETQIEPETEIETEETEIETEIEIETETKLFFQFLLPPRCQRRPPRTAPLRPSGVPRWALPSSRRPQKLRFKKKKSEK